MERRVSKRKRRRECDAKREKWGQLCLGWSLLNMIHLVAKKTATVIFQKKKGKRGKDSERERQDFAEKKQAVSS